MKKSNDHSNQAVARETKQDLIEEMVIDLAADKDCYDGLIAYDADNQKYVFVSCGNFLYLMGRLCYDSGELCRVHLVTDIRCLIKTVKPDVVFETQFFRLKEIRTVVYQVSTADMEPLELELSDQTISFPKEIIVERYLKEDPSSNEKEGPYGFWRLKGSYKENKDIITEMISFGIGRCLKCGGSTVVSGSKIICSANCGYPFGDDQ